MEKTDPVAITLTANDWLLVRTVLHIGSGELAKECKKIPESAGKEHARRVYRASEKLRRAIGESV